MKPGVPHQITWLLQEVFEPAKLNLSMWMVLAADENCDGDVIYRFGTSVYRESDQCLGVLGIANLDIQYLRGQLS